MFSVKRDTWGPWLGLGFRIYRAQPPKIPKAKTNRDIRGRGFGDFSVVSKELGDILYVDYMGGCQNYGPFFGSV